MQGIVRIAMAVPHVNLGNVQANVAAHLTKIQEAKAKNASLVVFPELSLTGASCGDLFRQHTLLADVRKGLQTLRDEMPEGIAALVGAPIQTRAGLYSCAVMITRGSLITAVAKALLTQEESRWFISAHELEGSDVALHLGELGVSDQCLFISDDDVSIGVEFGSELYAPIPPSSQLALQGAEIIVNLSAVSEVIEGREYRQQMIRQQSSRCLCGYAYVSAGTGESSSDLVYPGHAMAACCGNAVAENADFLADDYLLTADMDVERIRADRLRAGMHCTEAAFELAMNVELCLPESVQPELRVSKQPFIPADKASRQARCSQIFAMQAHALARRLKVVGGKVVVGISGGLDSTLALLAACKAVDLMGLPRTNILGITMPCFGTTDWTYQSALELMRTLGVEQREIRIHEAVRQHFKDIGHDERDHSVTFENAQARERTQVLMDVANTFGGIVLGTGDLSEIALGWCTYNADHMSMYGVNAGVPKTLVRWVVQVASESEEFAASKAVLQRILETPISPELLPPDEKGNIAQQTEELVGPYALHDFFLYYAIRFGFRPQKIFELCCMAFEGDFDRQTILKWLKNFYRRFFTQQFKRNCSPDGVKIGSVGLSPRGDWLMPSDATYAAWMRECEEIEA